MNSRKVALVTGATSGIGQATAHRLHDRGYLVYAAGRNPDALDALRARGLQARPLDVTDEDAVTRLVDDIVAEHGAVDVLVNSAGIPERGVLEQRSPAEVRTLFNMHVVVPLRLSQAVLPGMRARGAGTIVNIGSIAGRVTGPAGGAYHIVKSGLVALSLGLRAEVAQFGVRVVLIEPTGVRTPFFESEFNEVWTYADDDPYAAFMRRRDESVRKLSKLPGAAIKADTVARAVVRAIEARNPRPRYIVGASGRATVLMRALTTDRMWERMMLAGMKPRSR